MREQLEKTILGAVLLEAGNFTKVSHILSPKNFSKNEHYNHQLIWKAIESLYPTKPIDVITVNAQLRSMGEVNYMFYLQELTAQVASSANLSYHALMLVERSISDSFITLLNELREKESSTNLKAAINEIIDEMIDPTNDTLVTIALAIKYLQGIAPDENTIKQLVEFDQSIDRKAEHIKQQVSVETLLRYLNELGCIPTDPLARLTVRKLTELLKTILSAGTVETETGNNIINL